ncbi:hypothetical protein Droror1_Dr00003200 [Drosera rotundifolia]
MTTTGRNRITIVPSSSSNHLRRQALLRTKPSSSSYTSSSMGEVAGGATAGIAALCCCGPCVVVECLVLAVYKLPTGICRRIHRKKLLKKKRGMLIGGAIGDAEFSGPLDSEEVVEVEGSTDVVDLDEEMWARFRDAGFWRSPSQRIGV